MCRWAAYIGRPVFLETLVTAPCHSLIEQSHHALEAKTPTNGDGFGVAWYSEHQEPGLYRDILPAWSDPNLKSLCRQIRSPLFLAHVRASTGGATSRMNCHPFVHGRFAFMHNGQIGGFDKIRRALEAALIDDLYDRLEGTTDSELLFLTMVHEGLEDDPHGAMERAAGRVIAAQRRAGIEPSLKLTAALADGSVLYAVRYTTHAAAPTLYASALPDGRCLVSEPFDKEGCAWQAIPQASFVMLTGQGMTVRSFAPAIETTPDPVALSA